MTVINTYDDFAGVAATAITAHTPDIGSSWTWVSGSGQPTLDGAGAAQLTSGSFGLVTSTVPLQVPDYTVEGQFRSQGSTGSFAHVVAREEAAGSFDFYGLKHGPADTFLTLTRWNNGNATILATPAQTYPAAGVAFTLGIEVFGPVITGYYNGAQVASVTDTAASALRRLGRAGFLLERATLSAKLEALTISYPDPFPLGVVPGRRV